MAPFSLFHLPAFSFFLLFSLNSIAAHKLSECYTSMFNFGDSITDTGNTLYTMGDHPSNIGRLPYGETFFHRPTGRCTDGRVIVDFLAESMGIPYLPPYLPATARGYDLRRGANFAYAGASVLEAEFFMARDLPRVPSNNTLRNQLDWFKQFLPSLCHGKADCQRALRQSMIMLNMELNDYDLAFLYRRSIDEIRTYIPPVISIIRSAIEELIDHGATTIVVGSSLPSGCFTGLLTMYESSEEGDYSPDTGCLRWVNEFFEEHNEKLQRELDLIKKIHADVIVIYADYYNATLPIYRSPSQFGFTNGPFNVCCGGGGDQFNYNADDDCEHGNVKKSCDDPSTYVGWDGWHYTEAAYEVMAKGVIDGTFSNPPITDMCPHISLQVGFPTDGTMSS